MMLFAANRFTLKNQEEDAGANVLMFRSVPLAQERLPRRGGAQG